MENETHVADSPGRGHFNGITLSAAPYTMYLHLHAAFSTKSSRVASDSCMVALSRTCPKTFNHPGNTCNQSINAQQDRNQPFTQSFPHEPWKTTLLDKVWPEHSVARLVHDIATIPALPCTGVLPATLAGHK